MTFEGIVVKMVLLCGMNLIPNGSIGPDTQDQGTSGPEVLYEVLKDDSTET